MNIQEWYVIFSPPALRPLRQIFGHVKVCGYSVDRDSTTWMFFDPAWSGAKITLLYKYDEVNHALSTVFSHGTVLRIENNGGRFAPIWPMMNCATIVAHIIGFRAFTPWGLKRQLLRNGAEVIVDVRREQGTGRREGAAREGA